MCAFSPNAFAHLRAHELFLFSDVDFLSFSSIQINAWLIWPLKLFTWIMRSITQIAEYAIFLSGTIVPSGWIRPFCSFFRWDFFFSWPPLPLPLSTIELTLFIATFVPSPSFNLFCFSDSQFLLSFAFSSTIYQTYRW